MTQAEISIAISGINTRYIQEANTYFEQKIHPVSFRRIVILAAIFGTILSLCAFTYTYFSTLSGDNLILTATYAGEGVVLAQIENQSDRELKLAPTVKLLQYSTGKEIAATGSAPTLTGLTIPAESTQTVRIDLRLSYNIAALEQLTNDFVCIQLTNKSFLPGQKWTCLVSFRPTAGDYVPQYVKTGDTKRAENVIPSLKPYFENFTPDVFARWADVPNYLELVEQELSQVEGNIVAAVSPFYYWDLEEYHTLVQPSCFDGYNKLLGRTDMEKITHISIFVPRLLDGEKLDGEQEIPLFYFWTFPRYEVQSPDDYAFIRGNLLTFREMEEYKVYEDDEYIIYEMHHLVYSDLRNYVEEMLIQNDSIYFDDEIWTRIQHFYNTLNDREQLKNRIKPLDQRTERTPMDMDDLYALSKKGKEITFQDLTPYSRFWQDIDYLKGHGLSFRIDSDYEFFYALEPDGKFKGYYLYHNPTGDYIDIRYDDVSAFVKTHGEPQPRCQCTDTENGDHGWYLTLDWLINMDKEVIISYISHVCSYPIERDDSPLYYYPLDDNRFHVEIDWSIASGIPTYRDENIWLIHDVTGDRCNVRTEDVSAFIETHH